MRQVAIFVVTNQSDPKAKYEEHGIGYRIVSTPSVGDAILDVLTVTQHGQDKLQVDSQAAFGEKSLTLSASARWGDQYEEGAEIELRDAILSSLFYEAGSRSTHPGVCNTEGNPLAFLRWGLSEGESFQVHGQYWKPC